MPVFGGGEAKRCQQHCSWSRLSSKACLLRYFQRKARSMRRRDGPMWKVGERATCAGKFTSRRDLPVWSRPWNCPVQAGRGRAPVNFAGCIDGSGAAVPHGPHSRHGWLLDLPAPASYMVSPECAHLLSRCNMRGARQAASVFDAAQPITEVHCHEAMDSGDSARHRLRQHGMGNPSIRVLPGPAALVAADTIFVNGTGETFAVPCVPLEPQCDSRGLHVWGSAEYLLWTMKSRADLGATHRRRARRGESYSHPRGAHADRRHRRERPVPRCPLRWPIYARLVGRR